MEQLETISRVKRKLSRGEHLTVSESRMLVDYISFSEERSNQKRNILDLSPKDSETYIYSENVFLQERENKIDEIFRYWNDGNKNPISHKEARHLMLTTVLRFKY